MLRSTANHIIDGLLIAAVLLLRLASPSTAIVSYLLLATYALCGRKQAILALGLSWLTTMLSPGIAPDVPFATIGRYAVLASAATSVFVRGVFGQLGSEFSANRMVIYTLVLGGAIVLHSFFVSSFPEISILKAVSWTIAAATLFSAWSGLSSVERLHLQSLLFGGLLVLMLISLPLLGLPLGYLRNGTGFQGVLNHPQAFGPTMGLLAAWVGGRALSEAKPAWIMVLLFGACIVLVVLSEARTAGIATLLALLLAVVTIGILSPRGLLGALPGLRSPRLHFTIAIVMLAAIANSSVLSETADKYLTKRGDSGGLVEAFDQSRGGLIDNMKENIREHPFAGIGFGIGSDPTSMLVERDPVFGTAISAAVEKGVLPLAILEELGLFGLLLVSAWILALIRRCIQSGGIAAVTVSYSALLINMGESVLFSPGGMGLLVLILLTWAGTSVEESRELTRA